ncbi:uncharacterized protein LY89DRAFT_683182 [Mollisia scopiformis]|uniref:Pinin/SDK/MemA protein domain-containing protein n=1 Tax=Mollisia scopiformis TaxID=149040 RepID=A0A194XGL0_MOLSC|nr:uncharacterized protein LY89DRAFT_683182 [Mollisia scopiformis]KUJ19276.1 hypothetical protein LY89DRAFT_683182 [Mollisia scopiformis]
MADGDGPIASAVIIPDLGAESQPPAPPKRRQSSTSESISKRPRLSFDANVESPTNLHQSPEPTDPSRRASESVQEPINERRKSSVQEEKKRGQRLFGGLLSTLSQSTPNGQHKRRLEIEKRQQERAKQQKAEDDVRRAEKLAKLKAIRKVEQVKFDEETMRIRHTNMLAMAQYLYTKAEPRLYYIPWKMRPVDEERIKTQVAGTQALIEREVSEFQARLSNEKVRGKTEAGETNGVSKETVGELATESPSVPTISHNDTTNAQPEQVKTEKNALEEHNGEVVVENEEDTVIY